MSTLHSSYSEFIIFITTLYVSVYISDFLLPIMWVKDAC